MARFFGRYEHSLDVKGRVILPVRFRTELGPRAYLSQYHDRCLAIWTPDEFDKKLAEMESEQESSKEARNLARVWASGSAEVEIDRQGRMPIPSYLRDFARLEGDVIVNGAINRVELWNPSVWDQRIAPSERILTEENEEDQHTPTTQQE